MYEESELNDYLKDMELYNKTMKTSNYQPINAIPADVPYMASSVFSHLEKEIKHFEKTLDSKHEISFQFTCFGHSVIMSVSSIGYQDPNLLYFYGTINGQNAQLVQHVSQLNFLMLSEKVKDETKPPRRIGFEFPDPAVDAP